MASSETAPSAPRLLLYQALLFVGGAALVTIGAAYALGEGTVGPAAGRLALGLSAVALAGIMVTSMWARRNMLVLVYALFLVVSVWQIGLSYVGGLSPATAFGVVLTFVGCAAGMTSTRGVVAFSAAFLTAAAAVALAVEDPLVPTNAYLATLVSLAVLSALVSRTVHRSLRLMDEARREALGAARAKSEFLATMSHEIRTPMNGVIGMTELLAASDLTRDQRDYVETVQASGEALLSIINDVLDLSKIEADRVDLEEVPVGVRPFCDEAVGLVARAAAEKGVEVVCRVRPEVPCEVLVDPVRLRQVLLNLLSNAVKFTDAGSVVLDVACAERRRGRAALHVRVVDTGVGLAPGSAEAIFDSFAQADASTTRRFGGTGLGLTISKRLVALMGGEVWAEGEPGEGSTFHVTLSLPELSGPPPRPAPTGRTLLVVEDHDDARRAVADLAAGAGLTVRAAASAAEALAWVDGGGRYDLAAVDLTLGAGGAVGLAERLRLHPDLADRPLLLLAPLGAAVPTAGRFDAVLTKPLRTAAFEAALTGLGGADPDTCDAPAAPSPPAFGGLRVLLVEDHAVNQRVALGLLRQAGVEADLAEDGGGAVRAVTAADAGGRGYDVVFMDVQMPGMDGLEATRRVRAALPPERQPRIVALTANAFSTDAAACRAAGMDRVLAKPVRPGALRDALRETVAGRSAPPDGARPAPTDAPPAEPDAAPPEAAPPEAAPPPTSGSEGSLSADAVLDHLRPICEGDDGLVGEILDAYLRTDVSLLAELSGSAAEVVSAAHKLKAAAGTLGADALAAQAHRLEVEARTGSAPRDGVRALERGLLAFRENVAEARGRLHTAPPVVSR
ncbi:response regulator [Rubrivirga sp. S365]|uniref:histidine kinase n=1 Tax=Rubrivirga litoralis TaxID=3075598 RepID=A0ABU3BSN7_9BACT|nr:MULTISPECIES: response regulator [unclassified Rubrivirga]MDT0632307.1 response regulator [Rubrivirga sp. F394]MDT7856308.1 response regulator [Rubrivirga sp. S365]